MSTSRLLSVTLSERQALLWSLARGKLVPRKGGPTWDLDAAETDAASLRFRWDDVVSSLSEWLEVYEPPIIVEHGGDLPTRDPETGIPIAYGRVTGVKKVTQDEAESAGVPQPTDAIYSLAEVDPALADLLESGRVPYFSPGLSADYTDDEGRHWPLIVRELTLTLDPRQKKRQPAHVTTMPLAAALLSETETCMEETEETPDLGAALASLTEMVQTLAERVAALESLMADTMEVEAVTDVESDAELSETAALRKRVADLEAQIARGKSAAAVDALLSEHAVDASARDALIALHVSDAKAVEAIVRAAPKRGAGTVKRAPAAGPGVNLSDAAPEDLARQMVKSGQAKSLDEAWNKVAAARQGV